MTVCVARIAAHGRCSSSLSGTAFAHTGIGDDHRLRARLCPSGRRARPCARHGGGRPLCGAARRPRALARAGELRRRDGDRRRARHGGRGAAPTSSSASRCRSSCSASRSRCGSACRRSPRWRWSASSRSSTATPTAPRCRDASGFAYAAGFMLATALLHGAGVALGVAGGRIGDQGRPRLVQAGGGAIALAGVAILSTRSDRAGPSLHRRGQLHPSCNCE